MRDEGKGKPTLIHMMNDGEDCHKLPIDLKFQPLSPNPSFFPNSSLIENPKFLLHNLFDYPLLYSHSQDGLTITILHLHVDNLTNYGRMMDFVFWEKMSCEMERSEGRAFFFFLFWFYEFSSDPRGWNLFFMPYNESKNQKLPQLKQKYQNYHTFGKLTTISHVGLETYPLYHKSQLRPTPILQSLDLFCPYCMSQVGLVTCLIFFF